MKKQDFVIKKENEKLISHYITTKKSLKAQNTLKTYQTTLRKLADFLKNRSFKEATKEDLIEFFNQSEFTPTVKNVTASRIILFYRWLFDLDRKDIPDNMKWFEYASTKQIEKESDPEELSKQLITRDEYLAIQEHVLDDSGQEKALWEMYYLSGGRLSEVLHMKIKDVDLDRRQITLKKSKTVPRKVTLPEAPEHLPRWLGNHPFKHDKDNALWISLAPRTKYEPLNSVSYLGQKFKRALKRASIQDYEERDLSIHSFRKTRASIYWADVNEEGFHKWDTADMASIFGWSLQTADKRRAEYDKRNISEDINKRLLESTEQHLETFDSIKQKNQELLEEKDNTITEMQAQMMKQQQMLEHMMKQMDAIKSTAQPPTYTSHEFTPEHQHIVDNLRRQ